MPNKGALLILKLAIEADWHNKFGGICPKCQCPNVRITHTCTWIDGQRRRYHICSCGAAFHSVEIEMPLPIPIAELHPDMAPKYIDKPRTGSRVRKRK